MANLEIKQVIQKNRLKQWEIANQLGISEYTLCRKLRKELPKEEKDKIFNAIEELKEKNN